MREHFTRPYGCIIPGVLIIGGVIVVTVFFRGYGMWTILLLRGLAVFGPQILATESAKRVEFRDQRRK